MKMGNMSLFVTLILVNCYSFLSATRIEGEADKINVTEDLNDTNSLPQDLYVIRTIVYEIGILTNAPDNDTNNLNETHEQVDVSFFDPAHNGSLIDLSNIPLPIQTNISGVSVTGILPTNLGSLVLPFNNSVPLLPNQQITVTQNISTDNPERGSEIISNLPKILGLTRDRTKESETGSKDNEKIY